MAIEKKATAAANPNPRKPEIDREWAGIQSALAQRLGSRVVELMDALAKRDRDLWAACFDRIDNWLVRYFYSRTTNRPEDDREAWEAARTLYDDHIWKVYGKAIPVHVIEVKDLPFILQGLPDRVTLEPDIRPVNVSAMVKDIGGAA